MTIGSNRAELDGFDLAILALLQQDARLPQRRIAEAVALSTPAVQRRIRRLEEIGVILANAAIVDPARLGRPITILVLVEVESEQAAPLDATRAAFAAAPEVQQCYYVTGEADFVLVVTVPDMGAYQALTRRLFLDDPNVRRFRTFVAMERVKVGLAVPVDAAAVNGWS
ncbi:MAG: AsnC family transcriptional regulator [Tistrella sp.]|uniref:AsnC family transcriptional regulator n=1 Tax=Tistrella mobilis TaxID=171437 RepID=A0A3B9IWG3_9PROT|nr:Lrp/AsnC family transcriptional regulator [Tistrella sp.]MAD38447.1 AsnC family transcriptional regulator [Tistrella sp.]MBA79038.1 AsnC family transcriptional regulator [Tistrella sp.]HAE51569.1 AsnC family transcriptional regulator [Tistrella mobilis]